MTPDRCARCGDTRADHKVESCHVFHAAPDRPDALAPILTPENAEKALRQFVRDVRPGSCRTISCALNGTSCDCPLCLIDIIADRNQPETVTLRRLSAEKDAKLAEMKARIEKHEATPWPGCRVLSIGDECECSLCRSEKTRNGYRIERDEAEHYAKELRAAQLAEQSATLARLEKERDRIASYAASLAKSLSPFLCDWCRGTGEDSDNDGRGPCGSCGATGFVRIDKLRERLAAREQEIATLKAERDEMVKSDQFRAFFEKCRPVRQRNTEAREAELQKLHDDVTHWIMVADGINHDTRCPNHFAGDAQSQPCLRCQLEQARQRIARLTEALETARGALADISQSRDMNLTLARKKARRIYAATSLADAPRTETTCDHVWFSLDINPHHVSCQKCGAKAPDGLS
jgi:hypothetical protein